MKLYHYRSISSALLEFVPAEEAEKQIELLNFSLSVEKMISFLDMSYDLIDNEKMKKR